MAYFGRTPRSDGINSDENPPGCTRTDHLSHQNREILPTLNLVGLMVYFTSNSSPETVMQGNPFHGRSIPKSKIS